jgi:hypothetical protein
LLASAGGGVDQSPTLRKQPPSGYFGKGRLMGGRGVIFPGSHRRTPRICILNFRGS